MQRRSAHHQQERWGRFKAKAIDRHRGQKAG
jgi:hypothetical protein